MKKLFALLAVAAFIFAACNQKPATQEENATQDTEQVECQETEPVADIVPPAEEDINAEGMDTEAAPAEDATDVQA
ncbi:hypothetical protein LJC68_00950 [Bacteroidales bacterium OttesenSCG-928-B11]|nr:hypothetical protein [Bacteroidales bacterium OttesenSCG-928-C03]MDL2311432.1 hypothetical protein [Bacteroidales bacterium OttesenSCG-928-B11]